MKTLRLFCSTLGLVAASALSAAGNTVPRTEVIFDHPDKFADVRDASLPSDKGRDAILATIREFLVRRTESLVPPGDKLTITFTDIHLAGDYEPWRGSEYDAIRIVKPIYPPAFKFTSSTVVP